MVNLTDPIEPSQYATVTEVDGIRRTLDGFMKSQEETNQTMKGSLEQILLKLSNNTMQGVPIPEDKGSNFKDKGHYSQPQHFQSQHPHTSTMHRHPINQHSQVMHAKHFQHQAPVRNKPMLN